MTLALLRFSRLYTRHILLSLVHIPDISLPPITYSCMLRYFHKRYNGSWTCKYIHIYIHIYVYLSYKWHNNTTNINIKYTNKSLNNPILPSTGCQSLKFFCYFVTGFIHFRAYRRNFILRHIICCSLSCTESVQHPTYLWRCLSGQTSVYQTWRWLLW